MKCHNVLEISERASEEEILSAYTHKIAEVEQSINVNPIILERKRQELATAKEECLTWRNKSFPSRISSRVSELSSQVTSPNRLNECCIGPCSCCDWCCGYACCGSAGSHDYGCCAACCCDDSQLSYTPTIWCDIALYAGAAISVLVVRIKDKVELEQKLAEERAAAERERAANLQSSEQECRSTLKSMLETLSVESAQNALMYITGKPTSIPKRDAVNREFAIKEAKQYIGVIDSACMKAIHNHRLEDATQYLKLLETINSGDRKYKVLTDSINRVMKFLHAQTPYIITAEYADVNATLVSELSVIHAGASLSIGSHNLQSIVWGMALEKPFDVYSYRALIEQLSGLGMTIDTISSLIYVDSKFGRDTVERVRQSYWNDLCSFTSKSSPSTILSLASIAAWCGNLNVEVYALKELDKKQNLSGELRDRYELIKSRLS